MTKLEVYWNNKTKEPMYTVQNLEHLSKQSKYFATVLHQQQNNGGINNINNYNEDINNDQQVWRLELLDADEENKKNNMPLLCCLNHENEQDEGSTTTTTTTIVATFLQALEQKSTTLFTALDPCDFYVLWFYFQCENNNNNNNSNRKKNDKQEEANDVSWLLTAVTKTWSIRQRIEVMEYCSSLSALDDLTPLLLLVMVPGYFGDMSPFHIPLTRACCAGKNSSLTVAFRLLQAYDEQLHQQQEQEENNNALALNHWMQRAGAAVQASVKKLTHKLQQQQQEQQQHERLTPQEFALLILQTYCVNVHDNPEEWTAQACQLVLDYVSPPPPLHGKNPPCSRNTNTTTTTATTTTTTNTSNKKPPGLEAWISHCMTQHYLEIPNSLKQWCWWWWWWRRHNDELNVAEIAPALFQTNRLYEAITYPDPKLIVETIVQKQRWTTPEQCAAALEQDQGGLGRLLDALVEQQQQQQPLEQSSLPCWLAEIPRFVEARRSARGLTQIALFQCLYLSVHEFDPLLPPELLSTLPLHVPDVGKKALLDALQYLEDAGMDSPTFVKLPWQQHGTPQILARVVRALHNMEQDNQAEQQSMLWGCIDLDRVPKDALEECVPARILARHAVQRHAHYDAAILALLNRVDTLESVVKNLDQTVQQLQKKVEEANRTAKQAMHETKQANRAAVEANRNAKQANLNVQEAAIKAKYPNTDTIR